MALVYLAVGPGGKKYVGMTVQRFETRVSSHLSSARTNQKGRGCRAFGNAIRKHGEEAFVWSVLAEGLTETEAQRVERAFIRLLGSRSPSGYNLTDGGDHFRHSDETRALMAAAHTGTKRSVETRARMSASATGKVFSEAHRAALSRVNRGRPMTDATKAKHAANMTQRMADPAARAVISAFHTGRRHTAETKQKMSMNKRLPGAVRQNAGFLKLLGARADDVAVWLGISRVTVFRAARGLCRM